MVCYIFSVTPKPLDDKVPIESFIERCHTLTHRSPSTHKERGMTGLFKQLKIMVLIF